MPTVPSAMPVPAVALNAAAPDAAPLAAAEASPPDVPGGTLLCIPYRSQFDGSTFEWGNCGVSAIAMAMEHYGRPLVTHDLRLAINEMTGN